MSTMTCFSLAQQDVETGAAVDTDRIFDAQREIGIMRAKLVRQLRLGSASLWKIGRRLPSDASTGSMVIMPGVLHPQAWSSGASAR